MTRQAERRFAQTGGLDAYLNQPAMPGGWKSRRDER